MSAERTQHFLSEAVPNLEEYTVHTTPFPIMGNILESPVNIYSENTAFEPPLEQALQTVASARSDIYTDFHEKSYVLGSRLSRLAILRQMKINDIPPLDSDTLTFTKEAFVHGWMSHLQPTIEPGESVISSYLKKRNSNRTYHQLTKDQAITINDFNFTRERFSPAFINENTKRMRYIIRNERRFADYIINLTKDCDRSEINSLHAGVTDTYFFYKTYFDMVRLPQTA